MKQSFTYHDEERYFNRNLFLFHNYNQKDDFESMKLHHQMTNKQNQYSEKEEKQIFKRVNQKLVNYLDEYYAIKKNVKNKDVHTHRKKFLEDYDK